MPRGSGFATPSRTSCVMYAASCRPICAARSPRRQTTQYSLNTPSRWAILASSKAMAEPDVTKVLVFVAEDRRYGCPLDAIREIVPLRAATRLAGAPAYVVGLINLRGRLVTVVDLAAQLGTRAVDAARPAGGSIVL